jgi:acetyl esterase/lipase
MSSPSDEAEAGLLVPARRIPAPATISPQAQAFLTNPPFSGEAPEHPAIEDKAGWRAYVAAGEAALSGLAEAVARTYPARVVTHELDRAPVYEVVPETLSAELEDCAVFYVHGGAYIHGAGLTAARMAQSLAATAGLRTFSVDYRMPPDHPFPTGLDDAVDAYRWLIDRYAPAKIAVAGGSAGAGLAAALVLKARDLGLPLPGACVLATPEADLTESGDTFRTNAVIDVVLQHSLAATIALYADGHDLRDPYLSPLFGDFTLGFPPTILTSGTRDMFLSNTVRLHRALLRAGIEAELHVWEAMPHGGFFGAPEDQELLDQQAAFIARRLRR